MRGKRIFKKAISRMGSGRWRWNVLDAYGGHIAGGVSFSNADARRESREAERAAMKEGATVKGNALRSGSGGWRARDESGNRIYGLKCYAATANT